MGVTNLPGAHTTQAHSTTHELPRHVEQGVGETAVESDVGHARADHAGVLNRAAIEVEVISKGAGSASAARSEESVNLLLGLAGRQRLLRAGKLNAR